MEKKKIKCSYAILVIILFAALAFVVDYTFIEKKVNTCNCTDCGLASETSNVEKTYSYENVAGYYTVNFNFSSDQTDSTGASVFLHLYDDGTYSYRYSYVSPYGTIGNYIIKDNTILMNDIAETGSGAGITHFGLNEISKRILVINSDGSLTDSNAPMASITGINSINLVRNGNDPLNGENEFRKFMNYNGE